jgi:hypothetical protein
MLMTLALVAAVVLVAGSAAAASPKKKAAKKPPATRYSVVNGTANAASDHAILASSAFPNYTTGAVDNYYSMAQSHVDNSPFAEGRASPADTGPIGQTAAAGNFQQPQYADARWPGDSGKAEYGNQGGPYATAAASKYLATADASEASNGLSSPGLPAKLAVPLGFDGRLRQVLAAWKAKWQGPLDLKKPTLKGKLPAAPTVTVPTPVATVTTPAVTVGGVQPPPPPVTVPLPPTPRTSARSMTTPSRSLASASTAPPADGESLLESSTRATVDPTTHKLVTSGDSRLGRVSLGGGQIVIEGIHVTATITNGGKPSYKAAVSIASASIGGVPVTIDQDGVHIAGQGQALPYQQAGDALNGALKQAGIQIFLVAPEVTKGSSCGQSGSGSGSSGGGSTTTTTSSDQSGTSSSTSSCGQPSGQASSCDQGSGGTPPTPVPLPTPSGTNSSCGQPSSCDQTTTTTGPTTTTPTPSTTTSTDQTSTTSATSSCGQTGMTTSTGSCASTGKGSNDQSGMTSSSGSNGLFTLGTTNNAAEEKVTATGVHVVFTQPVTPPGVPAQHVEHILGEVSLDSLAVPAAKIPKFGLKLSSSSSSSSCLGGKLGGSGTNTSSGLSSAGGSTSSGSPSGFSSGSTASAQPTSSSTGGALPERLASILKKPLWVLVAFLLWQALAVGTAVSLLRWRKDGTP